MPNFTPNFPQISPADAARQQASGALIIDVRSPAEFAAGHISGAVNLPLSRLSGQISTLAAPGRTLLLTCNRGHRSHSAALVLARMGYRHIFIIK